MKKLLFVLVMLNVPRVLWCQTPVSKNAKPATVKQGLPLAEYAGEWTSTVDGKVWLRLQLELRGDQFFGTLVRARNIDTNDNGDIRSVSEEQFSQTVTDAVSNPDGLLLTAKSPDSQGSDRYQMRLVLPEKATADLKMIAMSMPPGKAKPKPWRLVKSAGNTSPEAHAEVLPSDYAGDWISTFEGKVWLLLQLELHGEQLTGWLTHSRDLELNDEGGLKSVSENKVKEKIAEATLNPEGLLLTVLDSEEQESSRFVMRLVTPEKAAALTMLAADMPDNIPKPKPWPLLKFVAPPIDKAPAANSKP